MAAQHGSLPFNEAIEFIRQKINLPTKTWADITNEMHGRAFVVAGANKVELVSDFHKAILETMTKGEDIAFFRKKFDGIVAKHGWTYNGKRGWRTSVMLDTNLSTAYSAGRERQRSTPAIVKAFPNDTYRTMDDGRVRPLHRSWNGITLPHDDPWWDTHTPPNGWNCFPAGTPVMTSEGWRPIEKITVGDLVLGGSGEFKLVEFTHINKFPGKLRRIVLESGCSFASTPNHRILTIRGWIRADSLKVGDILIQIPQVARFDKMVLKINQSDSMLTKGRMALPIKRKSPARSDLNSQRLLRQKNINPVGSNKPIKGNFIIKVFKMFDKLGFCVRRLKIVLWMNLWIFNMTHSTCLRKLLFNVRSACGGCFRKLFGHLTHPFRIFFCCNLSWVFSFSRKFFVNLSNCFSCQLSSVAIINPLNLYRFASTARLNVVMPHKSDNSMCSSFPSGTQHTVSEQPVKIETLEGFDSGAPIDRFNSVDEFRTWAFSHCVLQKVILLEYTSSSGIVYNLSIKDDMSYCIPAAVVHNCRCWKEPSYGATDDYAPNDGEVAWKNPATGKTEYIPAGVDPGFAYNPADAAWGKDVNKRLIDKSVNGKFTDINPLSWEDYKRPATIPADSTKTKPFDAIADKPEAVRKYLETIIGKQAYFKNPLGETLYCSQAIADHILEKPKTRIDGRERYFPFIREVIEDPFEIWINFAKDEKGKVLARQKYIKGFQLTKKRSVKMIFEFIDNMWTGFDLFQGDTSASTGFRYGRLIYGRK